MSLRLLSILTAMLLTLGALSACATEENDDQNVDQPENNPEQNPMEDQNQGQDQQEDPMQDELDNQEEQDGTGGMQDGNLSDETDQDQ